MDKILSSPTPLTNEIQKDDHEDNSLGLHSDAYAQSSQATAAAAQRPATEAVIQSASLPVGNSLLRTSTSDAYPDLQIVDQKALKSAEPAPVPASDNLLRLDRFSATKVSDVSQVLNSGASQKLMMSDFRSQLNISQLSSGKYVPARSGDVSIFPERVPLANRLDLTRPNGGLSSLLNATTLDVRQPLSSESPAASESKVALLRSQNAKEEQRAADSKPQDIKSQESKIAAIVEARTPQPSRESQPVEVKVSSPSIVSAETIAQSGLEAAGDQPQRRPATRSDDTAANTTIVDNSGSRPETKSDSRPRSVDLSINNGAPDDQTPGQTIRRLATSDSQRHAESAILNERPATASLPEGQKIEAARSTDASLVEGKPVAQIKPSEQGLIPSQRMSGSPETQLDSIFALPFSQQQKHTVDTSSKLQADNSPLPGSVDQSRMHEIKSAVSNLGGLAAQSLLPGANDSNDKRAAAPRSNSTASDVINPAQSLPRPEARRDTPTLTIGSTMGQSVKQLLAETSQPAETKARPVSSRETYQTPFERRSRPTTSVVDILESGTQVKGRVAIVQPDKGLGKDCLEGDQHKGKPKGPSESRTGDAVNPATTSDRLVTAPKAERTIDRTATDAATPKVDTSARPRTEVKPESATVPSKDPVKVSGAPERSTSPEVRGPKQETARPADTLPAKTVDSSLPGTKPATEQTRPAAEQTKPAETKPVDTKLAAPAKPADSAFVSQANGDRLNGVRSDAPAKQQDGTIVRDSLPRTASNPVAATADRGVTSAAQQALTNGQNDKAPLPSTLPAHKAHTDTTGGVLAGVLNSDKPLSRQLSPSGGELIVRNLPEYLGNQGQKVSQAGRQLTEKIFDTLIRDNKPMQPVSAKPPADLVGKTVSSLLKPIVDFKPVAGDKALPPVKEALRAATQPSAKPFDFVATRADAIKVVTDTTKHVTVGDVINGRTNDTGRKPQLPVIDASRTPKTDVRGTVKGDAPRTLQENSGSRINTGFRPVKEIKTTTDASAPAAKNPADRIAAIVKADGPKPTRSDVTPGIKVAPQEIKGTTTTKADVNGLPRRDGKQVVSESPKVVKATEVKAAGIKPVDVAGAIKGNSPRAIMVDTGHKADAVNAGRKAEVVNAGRKAEVVNTGRNAEQTKANADVRVNRTDSTRIMKGDSVPVVKVDAGKVIKVDVARVVKADQPQVNVGDRISKGIVAKNDSRSIKTDITVKGDAIKPGTVKPATVDLTKFDLSKSAKAEVIRSIKSNIPQLAEQIKVAKADVAQTVKVDANGLRKVDAAKVIKSDVAKAVEPKSVKIDAASVKKPEVANTIKADAVKFNTGRAAEPKIEVRVAASKVECNVAAAKVENTTFATRVDKRVSSANIETGKAIDVKLAGSKLSPVDTIQTVKVGVAQIKGERATTAQIDRLFGKLDNSVKVKADKSLAANEFINKASERANLKSAGQAKLNVKTSDIAVVRVENATISGDILKTSNRDNKADSNVVIGKESAKGDSKIAYSEAKAELRRILKGEKSTEAKTTESKATEAKESSQQAVWPIEGLLVRGRVGGIQVKEAEEITATLKVSQEFEEYLYEDETSDYGSDAYYFPGLKAALKFCEVVGLVELEEKLEQQKKDSERLAKRTLSPTRVRYEVKPGDTLQSIAIEKLGDARFVDLIVTINRSEVSFRTENGVRIPLVFAGQLLWLPSEQERSIFQKHYFSGKASKNGSPSVQISTGEDSATRTARVSAQAKLHSEAMSEQFAPQADSKATRLLRKRLPSDSTPIAQTLEKLRFAGNRQSVRWNEVSTGDPISGRESYQVKLGETLQSIALNHPRMGDVRFWVVIATLNGLPTHVDQYGQPIAIVENGQLLVLPTALELIDFCTTGNITGPVRRSRNTGSPSSAGDTVLVPNLAVSICQVQTEKIVDVRNFTPTARMIVSESSTDMDQFSVKLQVVVGYEWKLIASYDSFRGTATRTRYGINGIKATMRLNLPLTVVREMAIEDFSRNWTFHRDAFEANKPESRERTSGFNLRPVV